MIKDRKITLFLMSKKGWQSLLTIIENGLHFVIEKVIYATDKNVLKDYSSDIISLCKENNIPFYEREENFSIDTKYTIAISWRWIIPVKNTELIVLHDSLLPKYRGFSPLVNALINGENEIGVTALEATRNYDEGNIILQEKIEISYPLKISKAISIIADLYSKIIIELITLITNNKELSSSPQNHENTTYSLWRDSDDYRVDWNWDSEKIKRFIDAVDYPYKGAKAFLNENEIVIEDAEVVKDVIIENRDVGKVIFIRDNKPVVVCGKGLILILKAFYSKDKNSVLPIKKFRSRFK